MVQAATLSLVALSLASDSVDRAGAHELAQTPEPRTFQEGYGIGVDLDSKSYHILNEEGESLGLLGNGELENGIDVTILMHSIGKKVTGPAIGWVAVDSEGRRLSGGNLQYGHFGK